MSEKLLIGWSIFRLLGSISLIILMFACSDLRITVAAGFVLLWFAIDSISEALR